MSLEKDIQQAKFDNEFHKLNVNLFYTYSWMMERSKKFFEKGGLTVQQFNILRILRGAGKPLSTMQIRQRMLDRMSDTSRIVDRLIKKGLVEKVTSKTDRRLVDVSITPEGLRLLQKMDADKFELEAHMRNISEEEAIALNKLLDKLRSSI